MIKLKEILEESSCAIGGGPAGYYGGNKKSNSSINYPRTKFSSPEAKKFVEKDVVQMGKIMNKASQQSIKLMIDGVKGGRYDAMDLIRGIQTGKIQDTSKGIRPFLGVLWSKVEKRFRSYLGGKKTRKSR